MTSTHDPFDLQGQDEASREEADARRLMQLQEADDFAWLMSHKQGRRIVWRWLGAMGVFRSGFDSDALTMAAKCGQREIGLQLLAQAAVDPDAYVLMQREHQPAKTDA